MFNKRLMFVRRSRLYMMIALLGVAVLLQQPLTVAAAIRSCRADPIVWLSNGDTIQMTVEIAADVADVQGILYTLHAPVGVTVDRIVYTGGALQNKEEVVFVADQAPGHYVTDTVVTARGKGKPVTANTNYGGQFRGSVAGLSGDHLILNFGGAQ